MVADTFPRVALPDVDPAAAAEAEALALAGRIEAAERTRAHIIRLRSLIVKGKHTYMGTVPAHVKKARRAADKRAKAARKVNR